MKGTRNFRRLVVAMVCIGLLTSQSVVLAGDINQQVTTDVAMAAHGMLVGQVVDQQGIGIAGARVVVSQHDRELVAAVADQTGKFAFSGLRRGTFQLVAADGQATVRLWTAQAAPPVAKSRVMIVSGSNQVVRAQFHGFGPWILPALAAAGIIAGVAIATSNNGSSPATP